METINAPVLNRAEAVERMGDEALYLEIAGFFANNIDAALGALKAALDAAPDKDECQPGILTEAMRLAHSFKGNCATVGADAVKASALELELLCRCGQSRAAKAALGSFTPQILALKELLLHLQ